MRVCKHGCDVKMFCFLHANPASTNLKKFFSWKPDKFIYLPIPLKLEKSLQTCSVNLFCLSWHFKQEKSIFWKASYLQNKSWLCVQDFATVKNFSFNQCHNKELHFFSGKLIYKSNRKLFSCICIAWYKHLGGWENSRRLSKPSTSSQGLHSNHGKRFLLFK